MIIQAKNKDLIKKNLLIDEKSRFLIKFQKNKYLI